MHNKNNDLQIIHQENNRILDFGEPWVFEEFEDLFLSTLENRKKIKHSKLKQKFDYKIFHEKEKARLEELAKKPEIVILKSPPVSVKKRSNMSLRSLGNSVNSEIWEKKIVEESFHNPLITNGEADLCVGQKLDPVNKSPNNKSPNNKSPNVNETNNLRSEPAITEGWKDERIGNSFMSPENSEIEFPISPIPSPFPRTPVETKVTRETKLSASNTSCKRSSSESLKLEKENSFLGVKTPQVAITPNAFLRTHKSFGSSIVSSKNATPRVVSVKKDNFFGKIFSPQSIQTVISSKISSASTINTKSSVTSFVEDDEKRDLLIKFQWLGNKHPDLLSNYKFNMRSDLKVMRNTYAMLIKQLKVNDTVANLNTYLFTGFMLCEVFFGRLGFDMEGFTKQQISNNKSYESLLIELGEKEYTPLGVETWSVEARLCWAVFFNAGWFILAKFFSKTSDVNILEIFNSTKGSQNTKDGSTVVSIPSSSEYDNIPKMKGPPKSS